MSKNGKPVFMAILAAMLFGLNAPVSKLLLVKIPAPLMASLLYFGAGSGMLLIHIVGNVRVREKKEAKMSRKDLPYIIGMIALDIAAPVFMMFGLTMISSAEASLLSNFEVVATSLTAFLLFNEYIGKRMWLAIGVITLSSVILSFEGNSAITFSPGSVCVLLACVCWGFENNCTKMLSNRNPEQIVIIKGFGSGTGAMIIALSTGMVSSDALYMLYALALGFVSYGLSIYFYVLAQRDLGAARTSAYYAVAPFWGVVFSSAFFGQVFSAQFLLACALMIAGTFLVVSERHRHRHVHVAMTHEHLHSHDDGHHTHTHAGEVHGQHSHPHTHETLEHTHAHTPDLHHTHTHLPKEE